MPTTAASRDRHRFRWSFRLRSGAWGYPYVVVHCRPGGERFAPSTYNLTNSVILSMRDSRTEMDVALKTDTDPKRARILDGAHEGVPDLWLRARDDGGHRARRRDVAPGALSAVQEQGARSIAPSALRCSTIRPKAPKRRWPGTGRSPSACWTAIDRSLIAMMKTIMDSPHGAEILDRKNTLASDLAAVWRSRLREDVPRRHRCEAKRNKVDLKARGLTARGAGRAAARRARRA